MHQKCLNDPSNLKKEEARHSWSAFNHLQWTTVCWKKWVVIIAKLLRTFNRKFSMLLGCNHTLNSRHLKYYSPEFFVPSHYRSCPLSRQTISMEVDQVTFPFLGVPLGQTWLLAVVTKIISTPCPANFTFMITTKVIHGFHLKESFIVGLRHSSTFSCIASSVRAYFRWFRRWYILHPLVTVLDAMV